MRRPVILLSLVLLLGSCSLDYEQAMIAEEMSEDLPDTILINFTHTIIKNGTPMFIIAAENAEAYSESKKTIMEHAVFQQFNSEGTLTAEGSADKATLYTSTEDVELQGHIYFYSTTEESTIEASYLYWNDGDGTLTGRTDDMVTITQDSGTIIQGSGFTADLMEKDISFRGSPTGTWVDDDEDEE